MVSFRFILTLIFINCLWFIGLASCRKQEAQVTEKPKIGKSDTLHVLVSNRFVSAGMNSALVAKFNESHNTPVQIHNGGSPQDMILLLQSEPAKYDLIIGIDNASMADIETYDIFETLDLADYDGLNQEAITDHKHRFLPYAYGYLCLLYDPNQISDAPQSFGELQDPIYYNLLAMSDPHSCPIGRAVLHWSVALFGEHGYEQLWKSLRKNIAKVHPLWDDAFSSLTKMDSALCFGFSSTPNWYLEQNPQANPLKASILKEGSYLYMESYAIPKSSQNKDLAISMTKVLSSVEVQQLVVYKLGLFPANSKTFLPMHFTNVPYGTYTVNKKLPEAKIRASSTTWLEFWNRLFSYRFVDILSPRKQIL